MLYLEDIFAIILIITYINVWLSFNYSTLDNTHCCVKHNINFKGNLTASANN